MRHSAELWRSVCSTAGVFWNRPSIFSRMRGWWDTISSSAKRVSQTASQTCQQHHATQQGDLDEEINPDWTLWMFILLCGLSGPGQTLVGSRYPPPSPLADTHRSTVIFHPAQWASDRSGRGSASVEDRLAGLTLPYSPVNYGHLLGSPSLGAFQGPWLLP